MPSAKQKKFFRKIAIRAVIILFIGLAAWLLYQQLKYRKDKFIRYPEFGIQIPGNYAIHGIDVSKYQTMIAWDEVRAMKVNDIRLQFSFIKATEGIGNVDPNFKRNWKKSKDNGIIRGAYHFFIS